MEKILNKSKSMFFGRKKGSEDNVIRDSDSFYDLDDYSLSSSPRAKASQTMGVKAKNLLPNKPFVQPSHPSYSPSPGPGPGGYNNLYNNIRSNRHTSRRDTQPSAQPRPKPNPLGRSSSTSEANGPTLNLNAHGERYRLEINPERGRTQLTFPPRDANINISDQFRLTNVSKNETLHTRDNLKEIHPNLSRTGASRIPDKSFRGCSISAPLTNGLLSLETKYDPSTNRSNVQGLRSSAENALSEHISTFNPNIPNRSNQLARHNNENKHGSVFPEAGMTTGGGGPSPLRGRRSLNFFNTASQMITSPSSSSLNNERHNLLASKSKESTSGLFGVRHGSRNSPPKASKKARGEDGIPKIISSPILNNGSDDHRPFHVRAASDNFNQLTSVKPLSLRTQSNPIYEKKYRDEIMTEGNEKRKAEKVSPKLHVISSPTILQASASLPTPPTSSTTLSFIAGQLDIPEFDVIGSRLRLPFDTLTDPEPQPKAESQVIQQEPLTRTELETALKVQNTRVDELCERVNGLSELLNEEAVSKKLLGKRISYLENEIRGLRWIVSETESNRRSDENISAKMGGSGSGGSCQNASQDSGSRYEESSMCNVGEEDRKNGSNATSKAKTTPHESANGFAFTLKNNTMQMNRRKRFGLALDPSPNHSLESTPVASAPFRFSSQVNIQPRNCGGKVSKF